MKLMNSFKIAGSSGFCGKIKRAAAFAALLLTGSLIFAQPALASGDNYVYDEVGILDAEEAAELNAYLGEFESAYDFECIVYIADSTNGQEIRHMAAEFMQDNEIGTGENRDGMCIVHVPYERDYGVVFRGDGQNIFSQKIYDCMLDDVMYSYFSEGDNCGAYFAAVEAADRCMARYRAGKKVRVMDVKGETVMDVLGHSALIGIPAGLFIALIMGFAEKSKLKSIRPKKGATSYIAQSGVRITRRSDRYIRTEIRRTKKESSTGKGSGSSGSFSSGGESFSGGSRKY